ncbi:hypothetical protein ASD74_09930 [Rhizobium sp. Root564]|nr:hypothetical protein ASD74_09930 [Rhizobium sp. Root564]
MGTLVEIVPYNADWPRLYREIQDRLEALLGEIAEGIEHVGSTAVPGLVAKPYIDIDVVLKHSTHMEEGRARMQAAGLEPRGSRHGDGVFAFMLRDPLPGLRVYLCPPNSLTQQNRLRFRDILRQNPSLANHYATLKMALAEKYKDDGDAYTRAKSDFIRETLNTDTSPASAP